MKKLILVAISVAFLASATPVFADVVLDADLFKFKRVLILEVILKLKTVLIKVHSAPLLDGAAEAEAIVNVVNARNTVPGFLAGDNTTIVTESDALTHDDDIFKSAVITSSVNTNSGIVMLNQDAGNMQNQANEISIALTDAGESIVDSQAWVEQINVENRAAQHEFPFPASPSAPLDKFDLLASSVNSNTGIVSWNQSVGNMNNQTNALAIALGLDDNDPATPGPIVALSEAALGQVNVDNHVVEIQTHKSDTIIDSINNNMGIVSGNQSASNMNNQSVVISISIQG